MNLARLRELHTFNHLMAVELEADDYGYRQWFPRREDEVEDFITSQASIGYSLSDIDHHAKCDCLASWDEWVFLLDFQRIGA
jgi:hypothetical protein